MTGKARPSPFLLEDVLQSPPIATLYWLEFSATPLSAPVQLVAPSLKSLCLVVGSILIPPISSTSGFGNCGRSSFCDHAFVVLVTPPSFGSRSSSFLASRIGYSYWLQTPSVASKREVIGKGVGSASRRGPAELAEVP